MLRLRRVFLFVLLFAAIAALFAPPVHAQTPALFPQASPSPTAAPAPQEVQDELAFYQDILSHFITFDGWNANAMKVGAEIGAAVVSLEIGIFLFLVSKAVATGDAQLKSIVELVFKMLWMVALIGCLSFTPTVGQKVVSIPCGVAQEVTGASADPNSLPGTANDCVTISQPFGMFAEGWNVWTAVIAVKLPDGNGGWFNWFGNKINDVALKLVMYSSAFTGMIAIWLLAFVNLICLAVFKASIWICAIFLPLFLFQFLSHMGRNVLTYLFTSAELLFGFYLGMFIGLALINRIVAHLISLANPDANGAVRIAELGIWGVVASSILLLAVLGEVVLVMWLVHRVAKGSPLSPQALTNAAMRVAGGLAMGLTMAGIAPAAGKLFGGVKSFARGVSSLRSKAGREKAASFISKLKDRVPHRTTASVSGESSPATQESSARTIADRLKDPPKHREAQRKGSDLTRTPSTITRQEASIDEASPQQASVEPIEPIVTVLPEDAHAEPSGERDRVQRRDRGDTTSTDGFTAPFRKSPKQTFKSVSFEKQGDNFVRVVHESDENGTSTSLHSQAPTSRFQKITARPITRSSSAKEDSGVIDSPNADEAAPSKRPIETVVGVPTIRRSQREAPGSVNDQPAQPRDTATTPRPTPRQQPDAPVVGFAKRTAARSLKTIRDAGNRFRKGFGMGYQATAYVQEKWNDGAFIFDEPVKRLFPEARPRQSAAVEQMNEVARSLSRLSYQMRMAQQQQFLTPMQMSPGESPPEHGQPASVRPRPKDEAQAERPARKFRVQTPVQEPAWVREHRREMGIQQEGNEKD